MSRKALDQSLLYIVNLLRSKQMGNDAGNVVSCCELRAIMLVKLLMLTRCNLTQSNSVRLSNIALR